MPHFRRQPNGGGNGRIGGTLKLCQQSPHRRPASRRLIPVQATGVSLEGLVTVFHAHHRPDQRASIHHLGHPRQMLANLQPRHRRGDRIEFAPNLSRGILLEIEHVLVAGATRQKNENNRLVGSARRTKPHRRFRPKQRGQTNTTHTQRTNTQKPPPRDAVAKAARR